jgi:hypothetical protein
MTLSFNKPRPHNRGTGVRYLMGAHIFFFLAYLPRCPIPGPPNSLTNGSRKPNLTVHIYLVPKLRMRGSLRPLSHNYVFMTWCLILYRTIFSISTNRRAAETSVPVINHILLNSGGEDTRNQRLTSPAHVGFPFVVTSEVPSYIALLE